MSIILPHDTGNISEVPVPWHLTFFDKTETTSEETTWNDISSGCDTDGIFLFYTCKDVITLTVHPHGKEKLEKHSIYPHHPCSFFAFTRRGSLLVGNNYPEVSWLYSAFGYIFERYRFVYRVYSSGETENVLLPKDKPFF